jgi:hypothetical protein
MITFNTSNITPEFVEALKEYKPGRLFQWKAPIDGGADLSIEIQGALQLELSEGMLDHAIEILQLAKKRLTKKQVDE